VGELLDLAVARAAFRVRQLERALHDPGPWQIGYGPLVVPAVKFTFEDRVVFRAHFPAHCYLTVPEPVLTLLCDGEVVGTRPVEHPGDGEWECEWTLALGQPVRT
jgi:hypothetical protein